VLAKKNNLTWPKCKTQLNEKILVTLYLRVNEPTRLTTGSTQVSRVLNESSKKLIHIKIYKKNLTQPEPVVSQIRLQISTHLDSSK